MTRVTEIFCDYRGRWLVADQHGRIVGDYPTEAELRADIAAGAVSLPADSPYYIEGEIA